MTTSNDRWIWLGLSIAIAVLTGLLRAFLLHMARDREDDPLFQQLRRIVDSPWLVQPLRLLYAIGLPALALLFSGALTTRGLGLKPLPHLSVQYGWPVNWAEWATDSAYMLGLVLILSVLVRSGDITTHRATGVLVRYRHSVGIALREAVYHQAHWAFYREPFIIMAGWQVGAALGLLPVIGESLLMPGVWRKDRSPLHRRELVLRFGLLAASALLYILTQNVWVCLLMDFAVMLLVGDVKETMLPEEGIPV